MIKPSLGVRLLTIVSGIGRRKSWEGSSEDTRAQKLRPCAVEIGPIPPLKDEVANPTKWPRRFCRGRLDLEWKGKAVLRKLTFPSSFSPRMEEMEGHYFFAVLAGVPVPAGAVE